MKYYRISKWEMLQQIKNKQLKARKVRIKTIVQNRSLQKEMPFII